MNDIAYLALGGNLGDRLHFLQQVIIELERLPHMNVLRKSRIYETESVEGGGEGDFLNAVICVETSLTPLELLSVTQNIEGSLGRPLPPRHGPRYIDIDILFFEQQSSTDPQLQMPHPRMYRRAFVLAPLLDVLKNGEINLTSLTW
ncbi:MAG: 2-amino-4-hydroxy-6-hydroxymethyldihydropteridine diphosphokinase [Abditibacteriaceae bacterium]